MLEEIKDKLINWDIFGSKTAYELSDMRVSTIKFLVSALFIEGVICSLGGVLMSNGLLSILGGVNATIAIMAYLFRVWLK